MEQSGFFICGWIMPGDTIRFGKVARSAGQSAIRLFICAAKGKRDNVLQMEVISTCILGSVAVLTTSVGKCLNSSTKATTPQRYYSRFLA